MNITFHKQNKPQEMLQTEILLSSIEESHPNGWLFYGDPERTRTVDLQRDRLAC